MSENLNNFRRWFDDVLRDLSSKEHAGFAILMIAFPLLERYLRERSGTHESNLNATFFDELLVLFPMLETTHKARQFWQVYRNGLLHQCTLSKKNYRGVQMPTGWLHSDAEMIQVNPDNGFTVHPAKFGCEVMKIICEDFHTFEGQHSTGHPLPRINPGTLGTSSQ